MNKQRVEAQLQVLSKKPEARNESDLGVLEDILLGVKFASVLPLEKRLAICRHMLYECYPSNENIFRQGDTGDEFFIILSGSCTVSIMDGKTGNSTIVATLYSGDCFGELALMQEDGLRQATVTTREVCEFVKLKKVDYDSILKAYGEKSLKMKIQFLKNIPILSRLDNTAIQSLAYVLIVRDYGRNQIVCQQGQEMDDIFLLASGSCKVVREVKNFLNGKTKLPQQLGEPSNGGYSGSGDILRLQEMTNIDSKGRRRKRTQMTRTKSYKDRKQMEQANWRMLENQSRTTPEEREAASIFLEVGTIRPNDIVGDRAVIQKRAQETSVITTGTCRFYILNKWDFMRRIDRHTLDIISNKLGDGRTDMELQLDYMRNRQWEEYKKGLVEDIAQRTNRAL